jgi:hypothetical protein
LANRILRGFPEIVGLYLATLSIESCKWRSHWAARELVEKLINWIIGKEIPYHAGGRGRNGSQGWGQGSQGKGSWDNQPKTYPTSSKALEMKFILQTATFQTVRVYIIQLVQKSFRNGKDVADSIQKMEKINMTTKIPLRKISGASVADDKATEQEGYDILYKAKIDMYTKRKHELEDNSRNIWTWNRIHKQVKWEGLQGQADQWHNSNQTWVASRTCRTTRKKEKNQ